MLDQYSRWSRLLFEKAVACDVSLLSCIPRFKIDTRSNSREGLRKVVILLFAFALCCMRAKCSSIAKSCSNLCYASHYTYRLYVHCKFLHVSRLPASIPLLHLEIKLSLSRISNRDAYWHDNNLELNLNYNILEMY